MSLQRKQIGIFLLIALLTVSVAVIPDIVSDDLKAFCLGTLGPNYPRYLIGFFIFGSVMLVFLTSDFSKNLFPGKRDDAVKKANIPWSVETATTVREAKAAIQNAVPEEALKKLFALKSPALDQELSLLANRLAYYQRESRIGVQTGEEKNTGYNRICRDILDLITAIETSLAASEKTNRELRDYLRQRYERRLKQKLAERQPVNLRRLVSTEGTSEETAAIFAPYGSDEIQDEIGKTFQDAYGRLLIVGAPGAGKTTLLLQLAQSLLESEPDALPVVLNLATWQSSFVNLKTWLEQILSAELSTNTSAAKLIMQQSRLILLLDGLDEVKQEDRVTCLAAIGEYGMDAEQRFVITSRIAEYKEVLKDAPVNLQIEVGPLTLEQLEAELERTGHKQPEALPLLKAIKKDDLLREAVQTPFYFNTLQILFAGRKTLSDLHFTADTIEGRQTEIKERFIEYEVSTSISKDYPVDSTKHWLYFLASRMNQGNKVVFELADLQYDWWKWSFSKLFQAWLVRYMVFGLVVGLVGGLVGGLVVGLVVGLVAGLVEGQKNRLPHIETMDKVKWSTKKFIALIFTKEHLVLGLVVGLVFGLVEGLVEGLVFGLVAGLVAGLVGVLVAGLVGVLVGVLVDLLTTNYTYFIQINTPYQRFKASAKGFWFSILQHWLLRYQLYKKGLLPLHLVDFLNEMTARHLMETDGATWRFRHRIIQDHFADLWKEEEAENSPHKKGDD